jgi:predicted membrane protein
MRNTSQHHSHFSRCDRHSEEYEKRRSRKKVAFGFSLVGAGVLLILGRMGFIPGEYMEYIFSWQSLLIVLGLIGLLGERNSLVFSLLLIITGGFFLATDIFTISVEAQKLFWPVLLVIAGLLIILKRKSYDKWSKKFKNGEQVNSDFFKRDYVFGGGKNFITSNEFSGGNVSVVFGGCELDLTEAGLAEGTHILELSAVFGGVSILVPRTWNVEVQVTGVLGGFSDERKYYSPDEIDLTRKLIIKGSAVFGGGELKNR